MRYRDRVDAGEHLALAVRESCAFDDDRVVVLGIPRGGVPVAGRVSAALGAALDVLVAHKLGAPGNPEFAIGAVASDGTVIVDEAIVARLGVTADYVAAEQERQLSEALRRSERYRRGRPAVPIAGSACVVVDDGVATGSTLEVALRVVRGGGASQVIAAVPVGPPDTITRLAASADAVVCPLQPRMFMAVGGWYDRFDQVGDDEVEAVLAAG